METNTTKHTQNQRKQFRKSITFGIVGLVLLGFISFWWANYRDSATVATQNLLKPFELGTTVTITKDDVIKEIRVSKGLKGLTEERVRDDLSLEGIPKANKVGTFQILLKPKETDDYDLKFDGPTSIDVKIVDTIAPNVDVKQSITLDYGESLELKDIERVLHVEDLSKTSIKVNLKSFKSNKEGIQKVRVTVSDAYKNETKVNVEVKVKAKPAPKTMKSGQKLQTSNTKTNSYVSGPWIADGSVPASKVSQINSEWNKIPSHLRQKVIDGGWKLYITSYNIAKKYYSGSGNYSSIAGLTKYTNETVYVNYTGNRISRATIHEIGHVIDKELGFPSNSMEFENIFQAERYKMKEHQKVDNHCTSSRTEYFAQCFLEYCKYPSSLKSSAPRTYEFFTKHVMG